jgi:hypothetical protein
VLEPLQLGDAPEQIGPWTLAVILGRGDAHHDSRIPFWREPVDLASSSRVMKKGFCDGFSGD